jgi:hypothetical protein
MGGGLPAWLDGAGWCLMLLTLDGVVRVVSVVSLQFNSPQWGEEVPGGNFRLRMQLGSSLVLDAVGFLALLSASSVGFRFRVFCSGNSWMDASAVAVFLLATLSLWTTVKSVSTSSLSALHTERNTSAFLSEADGDSSWCLPCFGLLRVHFGLFAD